jgi:two-component system sensor histidine kinase QseC
VFVEDTGPGIPQEELELATNRFFRGRNKTALGSGLGLSIVKLALQAGGARLHLRNRAGESGLRAEMLWASPQHRSNSDTQESSELYIPAIKSRLLPA